MGLTQHLKIDNSLESANKDSHSRRTTADFYRKIMKKVEWKELLKEAYLIAPLENVQNDENGITPFTECEFMYPHHEIYNDKLILSIPKLKRAFVESVRHRNYSGEIKQHLERHMKDLEGVIDFNAVFNFDCIDMHGVLEKEIRDFCGRAPESFILKITQYMYEELQYEQAREDAEYWFINGTYRDCQKISFEEKYVIAIRHVFCSLAFEPWMFLKEAQLPEERALKICAKLKKGNFVAAGYLLRECWKEYA